MDGGGRLLRSVTSGFPGAGMSAMAVSHDGRTVPVDLGALSGLRRNRLPFLRKMTRRGVSKPLGARIPRLAGSMLLASFMTLVGVGGYYMGGHDVAFREAWGEPRDAIARAVGLGVDRVQISGLVELHQEEALKAAGVTDRSSLLFLDVTAVREALEKLPLVKEAAVRKLYPDELSITITERKPAALWQKNGELFVVAADGTPIDRVTDMRFARLPFVVGEGANLRAGEYAALLDAAGPLRARIRAGSLEAGENWTLTMDNRVRVKLPSAEAAREALARLAVLERESRILEKDVLLVDMRVPDRVVARQSVEAAAARAEMLKNKAKQKGGVVL